MLATDSRRLIEARRLRLQPGRAARLWRVIAAAVLPSLALLSMATAASAQTLGSRAVAQLTEQSVRFEENRGQADPRVRYISRARDYTVALTDDEALLLVRRPTSLPQRGPLRASDLALVRMRLAGASPAPRIAAAESLPGNVYLAETTGPLTPIDAFARVEYSGVYPGIDLVYYGDDHHLEFDFVVAPFADPSRIGFSLDGAEGLTLTDAGDLTMRVGGAEVRLDKPLVYQERDGNRVEIPGSYLLPEDGTRPVRFRLGTYDRSLPLVIDPSWMTTFGSTNEDGLTGFAVNSAGHPVVLGETFDPATFPFTQVEAGVLPAPSCFFSKFDSSTGLPSYTILFRNTQGCRTLALAPNDVAFFTGFVFPNGFHNNQGTTVTVVDDRSGFPAVSRIPVGNYDSSAIGDGVDALAVNSLNHLFLLGPCRQVGPGDPPLELSGYNETPDPRQGIYDEGCTAPAAGFTSRDQTLLTVVDITSGALLYASFLSPGEFVTRYGLAADDADRAYIVGAQSSVVSPTADAYRPSCLAAGTRGHDFCAYLMVLDTTTTGPASLVYATYLWNTENAETLAARLGPAGELYIASEGRVFDDFPNNRPTDPSSWPYSLYPALRDGIQLARFTPDANGLPSQFDFATVFDPSLVVAALAGHTVRDALAGLSLFPSGAPAVATIAHTQSAPMGIVTTFPPDAERTGAVWTQNLGTRTPPAFAVGTGSGGSLFLAGQIDRIGAQDSDIFVERIDAVDPGANRPPTVFILENVTTLYAESPTGGALLQINAIASDPEGDPLTYSWTGPFTDNPVTTEFFISSRLALGMQQTVTVTVDDGHGNVVSASRTFDVVGTPFVGTTATPVDSSINGLVFNYAPITITATGIGAGGGNVYLRSRLDQNPPIPAHLQAGSPPIYFDLSTDALIIAPIALCLDTRGMSFASPAVRLYHYQQSGPLGTWVDITSAGYPQGHQLCGQSDTLGTFAIFYPQVPSTAVQTIAGNGVLENSNDGPGGSPIDDYRDGPATATALNYLFGGAYDRANNRLFFSSGGYIMRLDLNSGTIARVAGNEAGVPGVIDGPGGDSRDDLVEGGNAFTTYVGFPAELVVSPTGDVVFFDRNTCRIRRLDLAQGRLFAVAGNGTCGSSGDGFAAGLASLSYGQMAFDAAGNLFLADGTNARIRRIDAQSNIIDTVAGDGTFGIPANGSPRSSISLPQGIAFDSQGHMLIAGGMHLLRISTGAGDALVDGDADEVMSILGGCNTNCMAPFNGDGLPISHPQVYLPGMGQLTVAQDGSVIFPDYHRIRRILPGADGVVTGASDEIISTIAGYYDFATTSSITNFNGDTFSTQSLFSWARFVVDDVQGGILVVDGNNHRVRRFGLPPAGSSSLNIQTVAVPNAVDGALYSATITGAGGTGSGYTWSISAGALPAGLALAPAGTPSTTLSGIPTEDGTFNFTVQVTDSDGTVGTRAFALIVHTPVIINTATVPDALEGIPYSTTITAAGGAGTGHNWSISAGALPPGLVLAPTGTPSTTISGTPAEDGTFSFTVHVTDSAGSTGTRALSLLVASSVVEVSVAESIVVSDHIAVLPSAMIDVTEQIVVTDMPDLLPSALVGVTEQIVVTDAPGLLASAVIGVVEQVVVSDGPQVEPQAALSMTLLPPLGTHAVGDQATITAHVSDGSDQATRVVLTTHVGPTVRVQFLDPGVANSPLGVIVTAGNPLAGSDVVVSLATSSSGAVASTAAQVAAALNASPAVTSLLSAQTWPGNSGLGLARPRPLSALTPVHFTIEGAATSTQMCLTSVPGLCSISYTRTTTGTDQVSAYLDVNGNGISEVNEPTAFALSAWFDDVGPVLSLPASIVTEAQTPGGSLVTFSASATDNSTAPVNVACSPASGSLFPFSGSSPTTTLVTCVATDASGNAASGSFNVMVQDTTAPQVLAAQLTVAATEAAGARGNVPQAPHTPILQQLPLLAGATDAGDASPARMPVQWVSCDNPSLVRGPVADTTLYPVGTNCFAYMFRDASGNVGTGVGTIEVSPPIGGRIDAANVPVVATDLNNVTQPVTATFLVVDQPGLLTAVPMGAPVPLPPGFTLSGPAYEIKSTALGQPDAFVCVQPPTGLAANRLLRYEQGFWIDVTGSVDPPTGAVCGRPAPVGVYAIALADVPLDVSLLFPVGGERVFLNTPVTIRWTAAGAPDFFDVLVSRSPADPFTAIPTCANLPGTATSCTWTPAAAGTNQARILIAAANATESATETSGTFTIAAAAPIITVTDPAAASRWTIGTTQLIEWRHNLGAGALFGIDVSRDGGASWQTIGSSVPSLTTNRGEFSWMVTSPASTTSLFRITWTEGPVSGTSAITAIEDPRITITNPNGGQSWTIGTTHTIRWTHNLGPNQVVAVELSRDGGATWSPISTGTTNSSARLGQLDWTITGPVSSQARIRVRRLANPAVQDSSDQDFAIAPSIQISRPSINQDWRSLLPQRVQWTHGYPTGQSFDIELSTNGGTTWTFVSSHIASGTSPAIAEVRLPVAPTTPATALVRVSPSGVPGDGAVSRPFTLQTPTITILMPSATAQWGIGTTQRADFVRNFPAGTSSTWRQSLDVSRDGGVTWQELRGGLLAGDPLTWQVTGPVGPARVRVRVIDEVVGVIAQDDSDVFAIVPGVRVTSPNTAVSWPIGAIRVIRWTHSYGAAQTFDIDFSADGGLSWSSFATSVPAATATTGMHTAVLPTTPTEEGLFRVSPAGAPGDGDTSDVPFTLR